MNPEELSAIDPAKIVVAGDWHGNAAWAVKVIRDGTGLLEGRKLIVQLGDFGIGDWGTPGENRRYLNRLNQVLEERDADLLFVDGNHEDFRILAKFREEDPSPICQVRPRIHWATRGSHWKWRGKTWLALGGAVSPDKAIRTPGTDWWAEEEITLQEAADASSVDADVMITHDCPAKVVHSFATPPSWWDIADLARSGAHRDLLQRVCDQVKPRYLFHGHLHRAYYRNMDMGWGQMTVTGLGADGLQGNWIVLDTSSMEW